MKSALRKSALREIKNTKNRFFSIFGIVAIGVGFFSGVKAAAPDMRITADTYYDEAKLMNFRLVSTYGFDEKDIAALEEIDGAEVFPSYYTDVIVSSAGVSPEAARVFSLQENNEAINTLTITEGRFPRTEKECIVSASEMNGNGLSLGSTVFFTEENGDAPEDMMVRNEYVVVGAFKSSMYVDKTNYGSTSVGNGSIDSVYYIPGENFCVEYNTEVYLRFPELDKYISYEDEYKAEIERLTEIIEEVCESRKEGRYNDIVIEANEALADAKKELADAETEAYEKIADGEKELADAKVKLDDAAAEIADGEKELADGEKELLDGEKELADAKKKLDEGWAEYWDGKIEFEREIAVAEYTLEQAEILIEENEKTLLDGEKEYLKGLEEYEKGYREFLDGKKKYEEGLAELEKGKKEYSSGLALYRDAYSQYYNAKNQLQGIQSIVSQAEEAFEQAESELDRVKEEQGEESQLYQSSLAAYNMARDAFYSATSQLRDAEVQLNSADIQLTAARNQLSDGEKEILNGEKELEDAKRQLEEAEKELKAGKEELDKAKKEIEDGKKQLADAKKEIEDGKKELEKTKSEVLKELADAEKQLRDGEEEYYDGFKKISDGKAEIEEAKLELADGKKQYEEGLIEYADGEKELNDGKAEAEEKIADAKKELAEAEEEIADLKKPEWYIFTRDDNPGYTEYGENANRINNIAAVFPVFFILVAALVCLTTMTRMVEEQRTQIGTLKALGYGNGEIISKYMFYAAAATFSGALVGVLAGMQLFPIVIICAYGMMYNIPGLCTPIDIPTASAAILVSLGAILITVFFTCRSALSEQAAQLMRPKAPKVGKRILIERIKPLWKSFNFSNKVTARNLFRYKRKMFMSTIGIAGCTALLLTGFALYGSINDIIRLQYGEIQFYDGIVVYDGEEYPESDEKTAEIISPYGESVSVFQKQMSVKANGKDYDAYVAVPSDPEVFKKFFTLRSRQTGERYELSDGTVYIDEKLSILLGNVTGGDTLEISKSETEVINVTLTAFFENYPGHYVYMTENTYIDLFGETPEYNTLYFSHNLAKEDEDGLAEEILKTDGTLTVSFTSAMKKGYSDMLNTLALVIVVIIVSAGALAYIVMYNLTNINITERIREIATLKVLGFYDNEVDNYIFRENILLTLLGTAAGLVLGIFLAQFIITTAEVDLVMFGRNIYAESYILAAVFTLAFSVLVTLVMHKKLKEVNMIEALKSVE